MFAYMFVFTENSNKHVHRARSLPNRLSIHNNVCKDSKFLKVFVLQQRAPACEPEVEKCSDATLRKRNKKKWVQ